MPINRVTNEERINTFTAGDQYSQQVTALGDSWVVTWTSAGQDGNGAGIYQQLYAQNGTKIGVETQVNTVTTSDQTSPRVTALSGGGWVVTWESSDRDGSYSNVYQQLYAASGGKIDGETRVNTVTAGNQYIQEVTAVSGGGWVVTWQSQGQDGDGTGVYQQLYTANGSKVGGEAQVNTYTAGNQYSPKITALSGGGWVVTWGSSLQNGIYQQLYAADGTKDGGETRVNTDPISDQTSPRVTALNGGGWVVTWESRGQDGSGMGVYQQLYAANGSMIGGERRVNTVTAGDQYVQQVTAVSNGWVVTWRSDGQDGSGAGVYQRYYENAFAFTAGNEYGVGTTGDDMLNLEPGGLTAGDTVDGGAGVDTLRLIAGGALNIAAPAVFARIEKLQGTAGADTITVSAGRLANLTSIDGGAGLDALVLASAGTYNLAAIQSLIGFETITGSASADTIVLTAAQFLGVTTIQGQGGTDTLDFAAAGSYDLTALAGLSSIETIQGSSGNDIVVVSTTRLAGISALQGGGGFDVLRMAASGTLNLSGLTTTTGFEAFEGTAASDTLTLTGAQLSQFEQLKGTGGADTLQLASAGTLDISALVTFSDFTTLKGSTGADTIRFRDIQMGNLHLDGGLGDDTLSLVAGGMYDLTTLASLTSIETIAGSDDDDVIVTNAARLGGFGVIDGGTGTGDVLELRAGLYDLSALDILNVETIRLTGDADVTFDVKTTALLARSTSAEASVTLNGATFTSAELGQLFRQGLRTITTILDGITQSTAYVEPVIAGPLSNRTVEMTQTTTPFASVALEATPGLEATATVTYDKDRGVLRDKDGAVHVTGIYTVKGTVVEVETALRALSFDPTDRADVIGAMQDTLFTLTLNDTVTTSQPAQVTVTSTATNLKPGEPSLSRSAVQENAKAGTAVGEVLVVDPNPQDGLTVSLTNNAGGRFKLDGGRLVVDAGAVLDFESARFHDITIKVADAGGLAVEKSLRIDVADVFLEQIRGTAGRNVLKGGLGQDAFVFDVRPTKRNVDKVENFTVKDDSVWLENAIYKGLGRNGSLDKPLVFKKDAFFTGTKAGDAEDRIVYDRKSGKLWYDEDGRGAKVQVLIAQMQKNLRLTEKDFFVI